MKTDRTPAIRQWTLDNGAVMYAGRKMGSAVLGVHPETHELGILVVSAVDAEKFDWLALDQRALLDMVFQLVAKFTGEYYVIDCRHMKQTDVDHVWHDQVTLWYYWFDETSTANGPFRTKDQAEQSKEWYIKHML